MIKNILFSGIYDLDLEVLGTAGIEEKTVDDLVCIVVAKEAAQDAAQDAAGGNRPASTAAAASYKKSARQETINRPQPARLKGGLPNGARPKKASC